MRFSRTFLFLLATILGSVAQADDCWICDDVVEVNTAYAECYVLNYDLLIQSFDEQGIERQQINFSGCSTNGDTTGTRGGLLTMGTLPKGTTSLSKSVYTLSRSAAVCLKELIDTSEEQFDPSIVFKLSEQCTDE
jgi:hypothetical protein